MRTCGRPSRGGSGTVTRSGKRSGGQYLARRRDFPGSTRSEPVEQDPPAAVLAELSDDAQYSSAHPSWLLALVAVVRGTVNRLEYVRPRVEREPIQAGSWPEVDTTFCATHLYEIQLVDG